MIRGTFIGDKTKCEKRLVVKDVVERLQNEENGFPIIDKVEGE